MKLVGGKPWIVPNGSVLDEEEKAALEDGSFEVGLGGDPNARPPVLHTTEAVKRKEAAESVVDGDAPPLKRMDATTGKGDGDDEEGRTLTLPPPPPPSPAQPDPVWTEPSGGRLIYRFMTTEMTVTLTDYQMGRIRQGHSSVPINRDVVSSHFSVRLSN